jgi:outer membrane protein TolC
MLQARQSQIAASQEEALRAAALPDPRLTLGVASLPVTGADAFDASADFMTMKQIGVMQDFPARVKRQARQAVADRTIEQAQALSEAERLAVRQAVAQAWIALWAAQREVAALQALREPTDVAVRAAKARLAGGTGSAVDAMATQNAVLELENRIDAAEASLEAARAGLARWLGETQADLRIEGAPPDLMVLPISPTTMFASIDRQAPLLPWRSREAVAEAQVDAAIAEKRPDWSVGVTYGQRDRAPDGMPRSDMLMVEFAIDLPLFTRNRQDRGVAARRAELDAVAAEREDARRAQAERVRMTLAEWDGLKRQVVRKETESLPLARDRAKTALAAYAAGGDLQPWLEARRDEIELHVMHARHLGDLGRAWAALAYLLPEEEPSP